MGSMTASVTRTRRIGLGLFLVFAFLTVLLVPWLLSTTKQDPNDDLEANLHQKSLFLIPKVNNTPRTALVQRAPDLTPVPSALDELYNKANEKGKLLRCWMKDPLAAGSLGRSKCNDFDQLKEWGWKETTTTQPPGDKRSGFCDIVGPVDPDSWSNENQYVRLSHCGQHPDQEITGPDGEKIVVSYPPTWAMYENRLYPEHGVIVADFNWNPKSMITDELNSKGKDWDPMTMRQPDLFQISDMWWLIWKKYTTPTQRSRLRYIAKHNIVNEPTQQVLARALRQHWPEEDYPSLGRAPEWPGKVFTPDMDGFAPLLGIDSIWGVPWFLIQHHGDGELGRLEVKKITVWTEVVSERLHQTNAIVEVGAVEDGA